MTDNRTTCLVDQLPRSDRKLLDMMAVEANTSPEAVMLQITRAYFGLMRAAPETLPNDPLRRSAQSAAKRRAGN
ncbi:MAG: hypothetical protein EpisKO_04800 [Epibacterium sp.]